MDEKRYNYLIELFGNELTIIFDEKDIFTEVINDDGFKIYNKICKQYPITNYSYLKDNGYNALTKIVDSTPLCIGSSIRFDDYFNHIPYYLKNINPIAWENFLLNRKRTLETLLSSYHSISERQVKSNRIKNMRNRVKSFINPLFCTFTINQNNYNLNFRLKFLRLLKHSDILSYVFIEEIGEKGRTHYHGFIDLKYNSECIYNTGFIDSFGRVRYSLDFMDKFGFNSLTYLDINNIESALNYCCKYSLKSSSSLIVPRSRKSF